MKKRILITGAFDGIGRQYGFALARKGHEVMLTTHTEEQAETLRDIVQRENIHAIIKKLDITQESDYAIALEFKPEILINNAAIGESGPLAEIPMSRLKHNFEVNVYGTMALTQVVLKNMITQKSGRIIFISSVGGLFVLPYLGAYNMTKFALEAAADGLRRELKHHNIHISLIEPGAIATGFNERMIATKYRWFSESSLLYSDILNIQGYEKGLLAKQYPSNSINNAVIHAIESSRPRSRYIAPYWRYNFMVKALLLCTDRMKDWIIDKMLNKKS